MVNGSELTANMKFWVNHGFKIQNVAVNFSNCIYVCSYSFVEIVHLTYSNHPQWVMWEECVKAIPQNLSVQMCSNGQFQTRRNAICQLSEVIQQKNLD